MVEILRLMSLMYQPAPNPIHVCIIFVIVSFLQPSYTLALPGKVTQQNIARQTTKKECLKNERKICCYQNDIPVWMNCSIPLMSSPFSCQYIRDDNGIHEAHYNQIIKNDRSMYTPSHVRDLKMTPHFQNNSAAVWNISWRFPDNIKGLRGFLLKVKWESKKGEKGTDKWVFKVEYPSSNKHISHLCSRIYPMDTYIATVHSLPNGESTTVTKKLVENQSNIGPNECKDKWKGLIRCIPVNDTTTKVCFFAAPANYNFTFYELVVGRKYKTWFLRIDDVETSANKVFCQEYNLMGGHYNIMLVARLDDNSECLCKSGCSYILPLNVSTQPTPKTTPTIQTSNPTFTTIPTPAPHNNLVVIITTVVPFFVALILICIFLYYQHQLFTNFFSGWFLNEYSLIVVDISTNEDLLNRITQLATDIHKETHKNVKSVVIEGASNDQNNRFFKNKKTFLLSLLKRKRKNELKPTYLMKGKNKKEIEKVMSLLRNAENVLLVHTEKSYKDILHSMSSGGSRDNVFSEIMGAYYDNDLLKWHKDIKVHFDENVYEDKQKDPKVYPPIFHLSEDIKFIFPLNFYQNSFIIPQDTKQLLDRIQKLPDTQAISWVSPDENAQVDDSIARNILKEMNEMSDSYIVIDGNSLQVYEDGSSLDRGENTHLNDKTHYSTLQNDEFERRDVCDEVNKKDISSNSLYKQ